MSFCLFYCQPCVGDCSKITGDDCCNCVAPALPFASNCAKETLNAISRGPIFTYASKFWLGISLVLAECIERAGCHWCFIIPCLHFTLPLHSFLRELASPVCLLALLSIHAFCIAQTCACQLDLLGKQQTHPCIRHAIAQCSCSLLSIQ